MHQLTGRLPDGKGLWWQNRAKSTISVANKAHHSTESVAGTGCFLIILIVLLLFWDLLSDEAWYKSGPQVRDQQMTLWLGHSRWWKAVTAGPKLWLIPQGIQQLCDSHYNILLHTLLSIENSEFFLKSVIIWPNYKWVPDSLLCWAKGNQLCCPYHILVFCWVNNWYARTN